MTDKRPLTVFEMSRLGLEARWSNTTPEQRRDATAKARAARKRKAAERRAAQNGGAGSNG